MERFSPIVRNPHLLTIAAALWPRTLDEERFPVTAELVRTEPDAQVLVHTQRPPQAQGEVVLVHGLEGSSNAPYMRGMAQAALEAGFAVHRFNLRGCGGTEFLAPTFYHSGQTSDLFSFLMRLDRQRRTPVFLVGFSLGGNIALKLAGELEEDGDRLLAGVCAISTPIDLAAAARRLAAPVNRLYRWRFLRSMKNRVRTKRRAVPGLYPEANLAGISSVWEFDDRVTAPEHGFRNAEHYYQTQSSRLFLGAIRVPTLLIQAQDDPLVPFHLFAHPAIRANSNLELLAPAHGGHLGFLSRRRPRFWVDRVVVAWMVEKKNALRPGTVL